MSDRVRLDIEQVPGRLDLLRNVYALAETDPMFPKAVTDFLETLSVVGPPA